MAGKGGPATRANVPPSAGRGAEPGVGSRSRVGQKSGCGPGPTLDSMVTGGLLEEYGRFC